MTLEQLLTKHEGKRNKPYHCTAGKLTIGVGHNIDAKGLPDDIRAYLDEYGFITDDMIDELLNQDIEDARADALRLYPGLDTFTENRMNALIDFVFNVGFRTARSFLNTNKAINEGRWADAAAGILASRYESQVGARATEIAKMLKEG